MSQYLREICDPLCRVLDRAVQLDQRRLAGYVANIDFWTDEIRHRLMTIEGYAQRRRNMVDGVTAFHAGEIARAQGSGDIEKLTKPRVSDVSTDWDAIEKESVELRLALLKSAKSFVQKCLKQGLIDNAKLFEIEDKLSAYLR